MSIMASSNDWDLSNAVVESNSGTYTLFVSGITGSAPVCKSIKFTFSTGTEGTFDVADNNPNNDRDYSILSRPYASGTVSIVIFDESGNEIGRNDNATYTFVYND